jgi:hypothetical protein
MEEKAYDMIYPCSRECDKDDENDTIVVVCLDMSKILLVLYLHLIASFGTYVYI